MEQIELKAESRTLAGRHVKKLRAQGYVPAVVYGSQVETKPTPCARPCPPPGLA